MTCVMLAYIQTGQCKYCHDKPKFGGRNTLKQCCAKRPCLKFNGSSILRTRYIATMCGIFNQHVSFYSSN